MPTKLEKTIRREIELDGQQYTVIVSPTGVRMTPKGHRRGWEMSWAELRDSGKPES